MARAGAELVAACCVMALGGVIVWRAIPWLSVHTEGVGPAYMPLVYGGAILGLGAIQMVKSMLALRRTAPLERAPRVPVLRVGLLFATLVLYAALMERLGYVLTTWLALLACFGISGKVTVVRSIVYALIFAVASYALFTRVLVIALPRGLIGL